MIAGAAAALRTTTSRVIAGAGAEAQGGAMQTTGTTATELDRTIDTHLEAYGEPDPGRRAQLLARVWAADGRLVDPPLEATGPAGIGDVAAAVQGQFPGHTFRRTTGVDVHHGVARYGWELVAPDGAVALRGTDVADVDGDGRLRRVVGFFDPMPALVG